VQRERDDAGRRCRRPGDQRVVALAHVTVLERLRQRAVRRRRTGEHHHARRLAIEAVHDPQPAANLRRRAPVDGRVERPARRRDHRHASRLVHHHQRGVLVQQRQGGGRDQHRAYLLAIHGRPSRWNAV
jgi:hypothetical protein